MGALREVLPLGDIPQEDDVPDHLRLGIDQRRLTDIDGDLAPIDGIGCCQCLLQDEALRSGCFRQGKPRQALGERAEEVAARTVMNHQKQRAIKRRGVQRLSRSLPGSLLRLSPLSVSSVGNCLSLWNILPKRDTCVMRGRVVSMPEFASICSPCAGPMKLFLSLKGSIVGVTTCALTWSNAFCK